MQGKSRKKHCRIFREMLINAAGRIRYNRVKARITVRFRSRGAFVQLFAPISPDEIQQRSCNRIPSGRRTKQEQGSSYCFSSCFVLKLCKFCSRSGRTLSHLWPLNMKRRPPYSPFSFSGGGAPCHCTACAASLCVNEGDAGAESDGVLPKFRCPRGPRGRRGSTWTRRAAFTRSACLRRE